jgi:hypothetical protein
MTHQQQKILDPMLLAPPTRQRLSTWLQACREEKDQRACVETLGLALFALLLDVGSLLPSTLADVPDSIVQAKRLTRNTHVLLSDAHHKVRTLLAVHPKPILSSAGGPHGHAMASSSRGASPDVPKPELHPAQQQVVDRQQNMPQEKMKMLGSQRQDKEPEEQEHEKRCTVQELASMISKTLKKHMQYDVAMDQSVSIVTDAFKLVDDMRNYWANVRSYSQPPPTCWSPAPLSSPKGPGTATPHTVPKPDAGGPGPSSVTPGQVTTPSSNKVGRGRGKTVTEEDTGVGMSTEKTEKTTNEKLKNVLNITALMDQMDATKDIMQDVLSSIIHQAPRIKRMIMVHNAMREEVQESLEELLQKMKLI